MLRTPSFLGLGSTGTRQHRMAGVESQWDREQREAFPLHKIHALAHRAKIVWT